MKTKAIGKYQDTSVIQRRTIHLELALINIRYDEQQRRLRMAFL